MSQGKRTIEIAKRLVQTLQDSPFGVYYDHGSKLEDQLHVRVPQGFLDASCNNVSKIGEFDLLVYVRDTKEIVCLVDVEESYSVPKQIVGDAITMLLSSIGVQLNEIGGHTK